jgi:hypothetical protein
MKNFVMLDYTFLFDPNSSWSHLSQFEGDLAEFFSANGLRAEIVEPMKGQIGRRILLIKRIDPMLMGQQTQKPQGNFKKNPPPALKGRDYKNPPIGERKGGF